MSVKFDNTGTKYVKWTAPSGVVGLVSKCIAFRYFHNGAPAGQSNLWNITDGTGVNETNIISIPSSDKLKLRFSPIFSTTAGVWITTNNVLTIGALHKIMLVYDGGNVANQPVLYVNGSSVPLTVTTAPVGTYRAGTSTDMYIGDAFIAAISPNGNIDDLRIYSGSKSAAQAAVIAAEDVENDAVIDESGLVFHAPLVMCKGLTYPTFVGATLAAGNTFFDRVNGYLGAPSGSPVGA